MALEDYKDVIGATAGIVTIAQMFSGVFICKDIYVKGSTDNIPSMTFIGGFIMGLLFLQHGILLNDSTMGVVNVVGLSLNVIYLVFYYFYCNSQARSDFRRTLLKGIGFAAAVFAYVQVEDPEKVEFRFGTVLTVLLIGLVASPLLSVGEIIRTKNSESLPFPMILTGTIGSVNWLLYGMIIKSDVVVFQNILLLVLSAIQLTLCFMYPKKLTKDPSKMQ